MKSEITGRSFYGLSSKDDKYVSYKETKRLMDTLNGKIRIVEEGGHFLEDEGSQHLLLYNQECKVI